MGAALCGASISVCGTGAVTTTAETAQGTAVTRRPQPPAGHCPQRGVTPSRGKRQRGGGGNGLRAGYLDFRPDDGALDGQVQ